MRLLGKGLSWMFQSRNRHSSNKDLMNWRETRCSRSDFFDFMYVIFGCSYLDMDVSDEFRKKMYGINRFLVAVGFLASLTISQAKKVK